jgi:hypothetical protein
MNACTMNFSCYSFAQKVHGKHLSLFYLYSSLFIGKRAFRGPSCPHGFVQQTVIKVMDMDLHDQAH